MAVTPFFSMSKLGLDRQLSSFRRGKRTLMRAIVSKSARFFDENFSRQGWKNVNTRRWKPLKRPRPGLILVKTGKMRRRVRKVVHSRNRGSVIYTAPYSSYHNNGTDRMPARKFLGQSTDLDKIVDRVIIDYIRRRLR